MFFNIIYYLFKLINKKLQITESKICHLVLSSFVIKTICWREKSKVGGFVS